MSITNTDPKDPMCCVLVYNDGFVIVQQCNYYQETSSAFTLETFTTMEEMQSRVDELGLKYHKVWDREDLKKRIKKFKVLSKKYAAKKLAYEELTNINKEP